MSQGALCVIQARMGSTRFPGKVAQSVAGRSILQLQVERAKSRNDHQVVIATSDLSRDDTVEEIANDIGVPVVRGSEADVLGRFHRTLVAYPAEFFVRLTADCPLTDPDIISEVVELFQSRESDYSSNVHPRTFPKGLDVEVIRSAALNVAFQEANDPAEREHVTPYFYRHPERFRLSNLRSEVNASHLNWAVDQPADLERIQALIASVSDRQAPWTVFLEASDDAEVSDERIRLRPAESGDTERLRAWRNDPITVLQSRSQKEVSPGEHEAWLRSVLGDPGRRLSIAMSREDPIGMVRVDVENAEGEVSIVVAPDARGQGHSVSILQALQSELDGDYQVVRLHAYVRSANVASFKAFERSGFKTADSDAEWIHFTWKNRSIVAASARENSASSNTAGKM